MIPRNPFESTFGISEAPEVRSAPAKEVVGKELDPEEDLLVDSYRFLRRMLEQKKAGVLEQAFIASAQTVFRTLAELCDRLIDSTANPAQGSQGQLRGMSPLNRAEAELCCEDETAMSDAVSSDVASSDVASSDVPLTALELSPRITEILHNSKITSINDLRDQMESLTEIKGIGKKAKQEIESSLSSFLNQHRA